MGFLREFNASFDMNLDGALTAYYRRKQQLAEHRTYRDIKFKDGREKEIYDFIYRVKKVDWFKPKNINKNEVDKQIKITLDSFNSSKDTPIKDISIEYRQLKTELDWHNANLHSCVMGEHIGNSIDNIVKEYICSDVCDDYYFINAFDDLSRTVRNIVEDATNNTSVALVIASAAEDIACGLIPYFEKGYRFANNYNEMYPNGNLRQLFKLYEMGLYPIGNKMELYPMGTYSGKFICYVPEGGECLLVDEDESVSKECNEENHRDDTVIINGIEYIPKDKI